MYRIAARMPAPIGIPKPKKRRSKEITFLNDACTVFLQTLVSVVILYFNQKLFITYVKL